MNDPEIHRLAWEAFQAGTEAAKAEGLYKDDPVMLVRVQSQFPATGEVLAPYEIGHYVGG